MPDCQEVSEPKKYPRSKRVKKEIAFFDNFCTESVNQLKDTSVGLGRFGPDDANIYPRWNEISAILTAGPRDFIICCASIKEFDTGEMTLDI